MQVMEFITIDDMSKAPSDRVATVWLRTDSLTAFRDFMQTVLDLSENPQEFMIIDVAKDTVYNLLDIAVGMYGMRRRTGDEILSMTQTGKWADVDLEGATA